MYRPPATQAEGLFLLYVTTSPPKVIMNGAFSPGKGRPGGFGAHRRPLEPTVRSLSEQLLGSLDERTQGGKGERPTDRDPPDAGSAELGDRWGARPRKNVDRQPDGVDDGAY